MALNNRKLDLARKLIEIYFKDSNVSVDRIIEKESYEEFIDECIRENLEEMRLNGSKDLDELDNAFKDYEWELYRERMKKKLKPMKFLDIPLTRPRTLSEEIKDYKKELMKKLESPKCKLNVGF